VSEVTEQDARFAEILGREHERADRLAVACAEMHSLLQAWSNADPGTDAALAALAWRNAILATESDDRGRAILEAANAMAEAVGDLLAGGVEMKPTTDGPVTFEALVMMLQTLTLQRERYRALVGEG
jgi:hypothetical protein